MTVPDYILLIHKKLTNKLTPEESVILNAWEQATEENQQTAEEIRQAWEFSGAYKKDISYDRTQELNRLIDRITRDDVRHDVKRPFISVFRNTTVLRYAASLLLIISTIYFGQRLLRGDSAGTEIIASTDTKNLTLPDSSVVQLNANSTLQYDGSFDQRHVYLTGEAFFDVTANAQKPFVIKTTYATIRVVGTSFNVRIDEEEGVVVVVTSGIVEVVTTEGKEILYPGNRGMVSTDGRIDKAVNTDLNFLSWKTKKLTYEGARLGTVLKDMERLYGVSIQVANEKLLDCRFNGSFDNIELRDALEIISFSLGITTGKVDTNTISVTGKGCNQNTP